MKDPERNPATGRKGPPPEIKDEILSMGNIFSEEMIAKTIRLYIPLHKRAQQGGWRIAKDLQYGPDERHRLDLHEPDPRPSQALPMVAFFHGGGFISGDKNTVGDLIYGNVANYFAKNGMLGINATYRLAPKHRWPEGARDVARVVEWLKKEGASYGGDPDRIFLFGHSAGAAHVGTYVFHRELHPEGGAGVRGAILMSGQYNPNPKKPGLFDRAYYGPDTENYAKRAAINHIEGLRVPVFIVYAELDPPDIEAQNVDLYEALCEKHNAPLRLAVLKGHNHLSEVLHLNTEEDSVGPDLLDFIRTGR